MASAWFNARPERARDGPQLTVRISFGHNLTDKG